MSMTVGYLQLTPEQLESHIDNPNSLQEVMMSAIMGGAAGINIDKAWHGIHFILSGEAWEGDPPLVNAVLGGTEIGEDMGYGPARYLTAQVVKEVADALLPIDTEEFSNRFNPEEMAGNDIYAFNLEDADDELEYFRDGYLELRSYYLDAAKQGNAMLVYMV